MGLNRMMMKKGGDLDLKSIKAMMTVGQEPSRIGFIDGEYGNLGSLAPNPLPNGVLVTECYAVSNRFFLAPSSIKSCTINNITVKKYTVNADLFSYIQQNSGKTIPVIFHFD